MKRTTATTFPSHPKSAGDARRFTARTLGDWGVEELSDPALLLVSEVVTNGVVHARTPIKVQLELHDDRLLVEVWDKAPGGITRKRSVREDTDGGRGLMIVEALSDRWGTRRSGSGKCVWFELSRNGRLDDASAGTVGTGASPAADPDAPTIVLPPRDGTTEPAPDVVLPTADSLSVLRDRAIMATELSLTIADPHQPDNPLIWVNPAFERMTGYSAAEAVGRNCRFLQGPDTDPAAVAELRAAIAEGRQVTVTLRNYRRDGTAFWNQVAISPIVDDQGRVTHFVGVQSDVTDRVTAELERERLYQAEQEARAQAEAARATAEEAQAAAEAAQAAAEAARVDAEETQHRLGLLAEATTLLTTSLDVDTTLRRLTRLVVPIFADWSVVDLLEDNDQVRRVGVGHLDPRMATRLLELEQRTPLDLAEDSPMMAVLRGEPAKLVTGITDDWLADKVRSPELLAAYRQAGPITSAIVVPLRARGRVLGALTLFGIGAGRQFTEADLRLAEDLGRRAGLAVDNARSYGRELRVAETLQRNLLPHHPPRLPGFELAVRYVPGSAGVKVGGDWYDVIPGQDGSAVVLVGDVMGHDLHAAALMGRLRSAVRAYAIEDDRPATLLTRLDRLVQRLEPGELVTMVVARIAPGGTELTYANAGHPPPLLVAPDGATRYLDEARSVLIGVSPTAELAYQEASIAIDPGATLLLYTDGLVEDRDAELGEGLKVLAEEAGRRVTSRLETFCDAVLARLDAARRHDDIALLAIRSVDDDTR